MSDVPDLHYYPDDPEVPPVWRDLATTAGVATGYVVLRDENGHVNEVLPGAMISDGDGKFYWQPSEDG